MKISVMATPETKADQKIVSMIRAARGFLIDGPDGDPYTESFYANDRAMALRVLRSLDELLKIVEINQPDSGAGEKE